MSLFRLNIRLGLVSRVDADYGSVTGILSITS